MGLQITGKCFCSATKISDAHCACIRISAYFPERLYLHCTCKRYQHGSQQIQVFWHESNKKQNHNFHQKHTLPPVQFLSIFKDHMNLLCKENTRCKCQKR